MPSGRLSALQEKVLVLLAEIEPRWALTGGGALAAIHLGHRTTRGLDLFWHGRSELGSLAVDVIRILKRAGLGVEVTQTASSFEQLRVSEETESVLVDLVAEPVPTVEAPREVTLASARILVDTPPEILVNKLCTLLARKELRDLRDVHELLRQG